MATIVSADVSSLTKVQRGRNTSSPKPGPRKETLALLSAINAAPKGKGVLVKPEGSETMDNLRQRMARFQKVYGAQLPAGLKRTSYAEGVCFTRP
jgi:hypothetical protein